MDDVLDGPIAEFVGRAVRHALPLMPAAGHPEWKMTEDVVIASRPLAHRGPSELATPEDQGVVEHSPTLQVLDQSAADAWSTSNRGQTSCPLRCRRGGPRPGDKAG